ncbi:MAG: glycogen debranching enzyme family protein [Sedimentisphaerales bacterium]|nr:glycogen debranching enzyme family protein [Sedimentisphaerales bacterium]
MLTSTYDAGKQTQRFSVKGRSMEDLLNTEWLLCNSRGGFSSGTIASCNTRRYHGLLVGSLNPPANRVVSLSALREVVIADKDQGELGNFTFDGYMSDRGMKYLVAFRKDRGVHFDYDLGVAELTKSVYLMPDSDAVAVVYDFVRVYSPLEFSIRPLVAMRDFHALQKSQTPLRAISRGKAWAVRTDAGYTGELLLQNDKMQYTPDSQWWFNFCYCVEQQRGQDYLEDLWSPGYYQSRIESPQQIVLWAGLERCVDPDQLVEVDIDPDIALDALRLREIDWQGQERRSQHIWRRLCNAASQFIVERRIEGRSTPTILAGYPWFLDWGRDTFISLPGLLLCTGRFQEAAGVLKTFAHAVDEGMIPNRFDDYGNDPHYNSIDASLWFVHAAFSFLQASGDEETFRKKLLPAIRYVMESYRKGTRFGIHADEDGLITGGDEQTQLTWMDAKCGGVAFTPRYGKAIEINALWYNGLQNLAEFYKARNEDETRFYGEFAEKVANSFRRLFWNSETEYLNDCILPDGRADSSLRPNQIWAVSLPHSPLPFNWQQRIVDVVERELLTPYGLRTLSRHDPRYIGRYEGDQMSRDRAYHQGTVWSHLIGPFIEAFLRVHRFDKVSREEAGGFLQPLLDHMDNQGCIGTISEIFDGDEPHTPRGAFAQAWSVAEVMRAYQLVNG